MILSKLIALMYLGKNMYIMCVFVCMLRGEKGHEFEKEKGKVYGRVWRREMGGAMV